MTRTLRLASTAFAALHALAVLAIAVVVPPALAAGSTSATGVSGAFGRASPNANRTTGYTEADGLRMLARAHDAAQSLSYSGTYVHQRGPEVRSLRIAHQRTASGVHEKRESLDSPPSETVRRGDRLLTYLPQQRRILIRDHEPGPSFPGLRALDAQRLGAHYRLRWVGDEQVAGRPTSAWALEPRDGLRYGYRFWADKASGLLLRAQTISEKAEVVEQIAFSQLATGPLPASKLNASLREVRGWRTEDVSGRPASPAATAAWRAGWLPPGFEPAGAWVRKLASAGHRGDPEREVLQLLYSDGLAGLSIFIEPWTAERSARPLQLGALNMVGKRHGKFWLTIVGEVPMLAVRQVADAIELTDKAHK